MSCWRRRLCATLLWLHAALLGTAVPVTLLGLLLSTWEGGDQTWKHRFSTWGPLAVAGQAAGAVLLVLAAVAVTRGRPDGARLTWIGAAVVGALTVGWAWVGEPHSAQSPNSSFGVSIWLTWSIPALVAAGLVPRRR